MPVPERKPGTGRWRKLHKEELHILHSSPEGDIVAEDEMLNACSMGGGGEMRNR
jgi:hypothetical protein